MFAKALKKLRCYDQAYSRESKISLLTCLETNNYRFNSRIELNDLKDEFKAMLKKLDTHYCRDDFCLRAIYPHKDSPKYDGNFFS